VKVGTDIKYAASLIKKGKIVAMPTETVYGLAANALNAMAVARIFELKERPTFDPLIVHISSIEQLETLFKKPISPYVYTLAEAFWPGPLTIVSAKTPEVPDLVTSGLSTVGVRMPSHPVAHQLIEQSGVPLAAPSANKFGRISPTMVSHVQKQNFNAEYILDGGISDYGIESTVVSVHENGIKVLRQGAITEDDLAKHVEVLSSADENEEVEKHAPGMLKSHYSPRKPLYVYNNEDYRSFLPGTGFIIKENKDMGLPPGIKTIALSENGNMTEMAVNLFSAMHTMEDDEDIKQIYIEAIPEEGIGKAIMDRVKKAAYNYMKS
jgi:L-threonylcarbamoyladenylate synthase